jgi:hypothetical protein
MAGIRTGRTPEGRFAPGVSGNPAGRPRGSLNKRTLLERAMRPGEDIACARVLWDAATGGDAVSARQIMNRLDPPRRGVRIPFDLPNDPRNFQACFIEVLRALYAGEISADEALPIGKFLVTQSSIQHYYKPTADEEDAAEGSASEGITETEAGFAESEPDPEPSGEGDTVAANDSSPALAQASLALSRQAEAELRPKACGGGEGGGSPPRSAAPADAVPAESSPSPPSPASGGGMSAGPQPNPSPACGGGGWGDAGDGSIPPGTSPHPDLPPRAGEGECAAAAAAVAPEHGPSPEEEFERRDRLWRAGLLGGRELIEHVEEKRRRGQYVNGLDRGFRTVHVAREIL